MLKIENLNVRYGGIHAIRGISLEVPIGKIVTLIGNGAGKSKQQFVRCRAGKEQNWKYLAERQKHIWPTSGGDTDVRWRCSLKAAAYQPHRP